MDLLERYAWPGNVRERRNVIEHAVVICEKQRVTPADLAGYVKQGTRDSCYTTPLA